MTKAVDRQLVERAVGGCPAAFSALIEAHYDAIYRMAWRWLGMRDEAEDVAQEVCVKLAAGIRSFRGDAAFTTWLYRVTHAATIDHIRARQRACKLEGAEVVVLYEARRALSPEAGVVEGELWDEVRRLPAQQRDAVLLVYGQELSHAEAAAILGCTEKTVSWHLHEARKRLRIQLEAIG